MTLTEINEIFYEKDGQLYWNKNVSTSVKKDSLAGGFDTKKYFRVIFKQKSYQVHRILYQIYNNLEEIPEGFLVDHKDRDTTNNSKENLRLCTKSENCCNTKVSKNNKLGIKNIYIDNYDGYSYYKVIVTKNRKKYKKQFQLSEEGLKLAITWRDKMLQKLHGEFSSKG